MKIAKLACLATLLIGANAMADYSVALTRDDASLKPLKTAEVLAVPANVHNCPRGAICEPAAAVDLKFLLQQCTNRLGPVTYASHFDERTNKRVIDVSAIEIVSKTRAQCFAAKYETVRIHLGLGFVDPADVEVNFMEYSAAAARP